MVHHFVLKILFYAVARYPHLLHRHRHRLAGMIWFMSGHLRRVCRDNGKYILGPEATEAELTDYGRGVIAEFLRFVAEIAMARDQSREKILSRVTAIDGNDYFEAARQLGRGLIIATCHCGNFEVGAAAVSDRISETHVLFQGDTQGGFERMRASLHGQLGLTEAHVEQGLSAWMQLRDALARGGAVLIQADRCMPGQEGTPTPFLDGSVLLPDGPAKLARLSGAPILPVVCVVQEDETIRLILAQPIDPDGAEPSAFDQYVRDRLAEFFGKIVRSYPTQWHTLHHVFHENETPSVSGDA
jgi:KDO2-lipid IV(A) lauroyltransferase